MTQAEVEPWLRGTLTELDPLRRGVVHALHLAGEDVERWCSLLDDAELMAVPLGLPAVSVQMRHMVRSLDRLLTYAEGGALSEEQMQALHSEGVETAREALFAEFCDGMEAAERRVRSFAAGSYTENRGVGRKRLPSTVGGLLVHCADHTQRHAGQLVTTAKVVLAMRGA